MIHEAAAPLYGRLDLRPGEARVLNATPVAAGTFMLFVSTLEPRKNLPTLLQALRICLDRRPGRGYLLVVAGARGWRDEVIFDTVRDLRLGDHVLFAGNVGQYDLRWLYNACRFYINPSLYEGFGLPLLEAMACGAACLAAATSSLPEIGGDAAIYIPPLDAGLWADAIEELWDDEERQRELGHLGRVRAQRFSWLRAARETLKVYERAVERARPKPAAQPTARDQRWRSAEHEARTADEELVQAAQTEPAFGAAPDAAGDSRACLRCGTAMLAGQLQRGITIKRPRTGTDHHPLAPRVWACPRCGHVELVVEQVEAVQAKLSDVAPADAPASAAGAPASELIAPAAEDDEDALAASTPAVEAPTTIDEGFPAAGAPASELIAPVSEDDEDAPAADVPAEQAATSAPDVDVPTVADDEDAPAAVMPSDPSAVVGARPAAPAVGEDEAPSTTSTPDEAFPAAGAPRNGESDEGLTVAEAIAPASEMPDDPERLKIGSRGAHTSNGPPDPSAPDALVPARVVAPPTTDDSDRPASPPARRRQSRAKRKRS
jgi:hypothetical protein